MTATGPVPAERAQLVTFRVGDDLFAADIFSVERVLRFTAPRPIPNVPAWLDGVIDYGGRVVPVIDLRARFELPASSSRETARILVVTVAANEWIGVIVDGVDEVTTVSADQLAPPPPIFRGLGRQYLRALVRPRAEGEPVMVVLDLSQLLGTRERIVLEQAVAGATSHA
jgi:purine-binding chemotaxis protein CheW